MLDISIKAVDDASKFFDNMLNPVSDKNFINMNEVGIGGMTDAEMRAYEAANPEVNNNIPTETLPAAVSNRNDDKRMALEAESAKFLADLIAKGMQKVIGQSNGSMVLRYENGGR